MSISDWIRIWWISDKIRTPDQKKAFRVFCSISYGSLKKTHIMLGKMKTRGKLNAGITAGTTNLCRKGQKRMAK